MNKKRLSIFLDEAGDAGKYEYHNPYYVVSFVFHNQDDEISDAINSFDLKMDSLGYKNIAIHSGPIIRKEKEFKEESISMTKLFNYFLLFSINKNYNVRKVRKVRNYGR